MVLSDRGPFIRHSAAVSLRAVAAAEVIIAISLRYPHKMPKIGYNTPVANETKLYLPEQGITTR